LRDALTAVAVVLVLALTAALIGPHLVDWNSRRDVIAQRLSAAVGQDVTISGPVSVELLPTPILKLSRIEFGPGQLQGSVGRFRVKLAVPPLLRGRLQVTEAVIQGADLSVLPGGAAPVATADPPSILAAIGFDRLQLRDSRLAILKPAGETHVSFDKIDGEIEASSLLGPFRGAISFSAPEGRRTLRFSTGRLENQALRLRALVEHEAVAMRADYDGIIRAENGSLKGQGRLAASGTAAVPLPEGVGNVIWRMAAKVNGSTTSATLDDIELALGNTERQTILTGNGDFDLARTPAMKTTLSTRQLDVDRLLSEGETRAPRSPEAILRALQSASAAPRSRPGLSGEVDVTVGSLLVGGDVAVGPRIVLRAGDGRFAIKHLSGELPGRTQLSLEGGESADGTLAGKASLESRDLAKLSGWFHGVPPRPLAFRGVKLAGDLTQRPGEVMISGAQLTADEMQLSGTVRLLTQSERPRLELRLAADQIDVAKLPEIPDGDASGSWDLDVAVDARRVRYGGVGAGDIRLQFRKDRSSITLDDLSIRNLDGADLVASGTLDEAMPRLTAELKATRMDALLKLADRLSSHWLVPVLATRAKSLAPADLRVNWTAGPQRDAPRQLVAAGTLGGTAIDLRAAVTAQGDLAGANAFALNIKAASPELLIRQIGLDAIPVTTAGPVDLRLLGGGWQASKPDVDWGLKGAFGGLAIDLQGRQTTDPAQPFVGRLRLNTRDLSPLAQTLLIAVPAVAPGQDFALDAGLDLRGYRITLRDLTMASGPSRVRGEIAFNLAEFGRVSGQLRTTRLDASSIAPLIFGSSPRENAGWSRSTFGPPAAVTLPGDLWVDAEGIDLGDGLTIEKPKFVLRFDNGLIFVEHAEGEWMNGRFKGNATFRRNQQNVSFTGRFGLDGWHLDRMPVRTAGGNLRGQASAQLDISATGDSPFGLVSALAGNGRLDVRRAEVAGLSQGLLADFLTSAERESLPVTRDAVAQQFGRRLSGSLALPPSQTPLSIAAGVMRAGPFRVTGQGEEITSSLAIDLKDFTLNARTGVVASQAPKGWSGPAPSAELMLRGPIQAPVREVDVSGLTSGLAAIAIQRETERIELLEQDQRERSFFNRRLRASEEQRRLDEEERRRQEAARRLAEEQRRRDEAQERLRREQDLRQRFGEPPAGNAPLSITPPSTR
jgi:hypothetical protein